jgi:DNA (cytosine-5)-methyltransferase 1
VTTTADTCDYCFNDPCDCDHAFWAKVTDGLLASARKAVVADDLFAGAGGWDLAAQALGIHARGIENMPEARATRDAAGLETIHDDVWTYRPKYQARHSGLTLQASGLIASPPCQTFSAAGKGAGRKALDDVLALIPAVPTMTLTELRTAAATLGDDERTALVLTPLWFAVHHPYKWLAWEQVPQVLPVWEACAEVLDGLGWNVATGILNVADFGGPQERKRATLLASLDHPVSLPVPTAPASTLGEALAWPAWSTVHHIRGSGMTERHGPRPGRRADQPCFTVTSKSRSWEVEDVRSGARRRFSIGEASVVQGFPMDFPWQGSRSRQFLLCGNAVPPLMALHALSVASGIAIPNLTAEENVA